MNDSATSGKTAGTLKAIALAYEDPTKLPMVLASGQDALARLILQIAEDQNIPVQQNKELVALLDKQSSGPILSTKALKVLSEVIAFLYHSDSLWRTQNLKSQHPKPA